MASAATTEEGSLTGARHLVAVASGKGGVGKSTVSVNLALALNQTGSRVGLVDADVLGPSIPVMLGLHGAPAPTANAQGQAIPPERYGIRFISMGLLTGDDAPAILRGPMVTKYLQMFIGGVAWGALDYLILDLPPGTGDTQLTLAQSVPLSGAIIVTTPQDVSLNIARRGLRMFEKVKVPILGVVENMSGFACPHCGKTTDIFRSGGGDRMSRALKVPFLGQVPLDPEVVLSGDEGTPIVVRRPDCAASLAYREMARRLATALETSATDAVQTFIWNWETGQGAPSSPVSPTRPGASPRVPASFRRKDARTLAIVWADGREDEFDVRDLRLSCQCALCVDELSGRKTLDPQSIRADVAPRSLSSVGNYAIAITWSDGHNSSIYSFEHLRSLADRSRAQGTRDV